MTLARLTLRARLTLVVTLIAALGITIGGIVMLAALERALTASLDESARADARDIAALVDAGRVSDPLPTFGAAVAQVIDDEGRVNASTPGGDRLAPIIGGADLARARSGDAIEMDGTRLGDPDPYRVVAVEAGPSDDRQTVLVAVSLADQQRGGGVLRTWLPVIVVLLTAAVAALSWFGIGRALRPVEALRAGAAEITGSGGVDRLPVPAADDEISRLALTLNDMLSRLDAAAERQRAFVADAAHELRSPIAALRTELEVALVHPDQVDPHETAREALDEVQRMGRLVDDLLVLARLDARRGTAARAQRVDLRDLVLDEVRRLPAARVAVTVPEGRPVEAVVDVESLSRAIRNLLDNAARHAATRVVVDVARFARTVEIGVSDDGPGIPAADRSRIFDRFARLDHARARDAGGTGLGLAIVREIVHAHGGTVRVDDARVDGARPGARFLLTLPVGSEGQSLP